MGRSLSGGLPRSVLKPLVEVLVAVLNELLDFLPYLPRRMLWMSWRSWPQTTSKNSHAGSRTGRAVVARRRSAVLIRRRCGGAWHAPPGWNLRPARSKSSVDSRVASRRRRSQPSWTDQTRWAPVARFCQTSDQSMDIQKSRDIHPKSLAQTRTGWQSSSSEIICASSFRMVVFSARAPNFCRGRRRLMSSTKTVALKKRPPFFSLCPGPSDLIRLERHGDDDDRLAVGVDFLDDAGDVVRRVFGQIAPAAGARAGAPRPPSGKRRRSPTQRPPSTSRSAGPGCRAPRDPVEEGEEGDLPAVGGALSESDSLGRRAGYPVV